MQAPGFVQQPCSRCGATVYIAQATGTGFCPSCHQQNQIADGAPAATAGYGMPNMQNVSSGGFGLMKVFGGVGAVVVIGALSLGGWYAKRHFFGGGGKGKIGYGQLGISPSAADGDKMISSVAGLATKWKKDAVWWSVNYQAVKADGTVILEKGAMVEYVSPSRVQAASKKGREDSIKKFQFGASGVDFGKTWNATNQWKNVIPPPAPQCSMKQMLATLAPKGLTGEKTVRVTFDPQFQNVNVPTWHVIGEDPKIDAYYSMVDCSEVPK